MWILTMTMAMAADGESLKRAADLPVLAHELRQNGVPTGEVGKAVAAGKGKGLSVEESADALDEAKRDVKEHGPVDNFGAFVQSKLDEGLRGKELAAAIKQEHKVRGKGKGHGMKGEHGKAGEHGKKGEHGKAGEHGKKGEHGKAGEHGKKGEHGKAGEHGQAGGKGKGTTREQPSGGKGKGTTRAQPSGGKGKGATRPAPSGGKGKGSSR